MARTNQTNVIPVVQRPVRLDDLAVQEGASRALVTPGCGGFRVRSCDRSYASVGARSVSVWMRSAVMNSW